MLGCGHPGKCHDCLDGVSFEELSCNCGKTKMYPPIPCNLEDDEPCPPCMIFTERKCACEKKEMKNIPCSSLRSPSCGLMCEKLIEGCGHNCKRFCHVGECVDAVHSCQERCRRTRAICGHRCKYFCHGTSFCTEEKPCLAVVTSTCACGRRKVEQKCGADKENLGISKVELPCDEGCAVMERNKRLAEAFDKVEDDEIVSSELDYSESLAKFAHTKPEECKNVEEKLATFVAAVATNPIDYKILSSRTESNKIIAGWDASGVVEAVDQTKNYFYFPKSKMKKSLFISELATQHYNLNAEILDANIGMANVVVRKGVGKKGQIPALLLSEVAVNYSPQLYENINLHKQNNQLSHTEIIENSKENNFNGIFLRNISFGIEVNDLKILLEPFFHTNFIPSLKKIKNVCKEDCFIILFNTNKQDPNQNFEKDLKNFYKIVEKKFCIDNNFASSCNLCFVDCEGRVNLKDDFGEELYKKEEILSTNNLQKKNSFNNENLKNSTLENSFNKFNILDDE
ncbi:FKBP12-associated protein [Clydaea vesicula]|uniref:FKBP12-associated protein n=1 Tax=Clydaea vesicula TaxID=447962 RepID=A0AAD5TUT3_9FUNG|nr:FKBP12-associated protein [Clydaea vesicula]